MFNYDKCAIPTVYCGNNKDLPPKKQGSNTYYLRHGTGFECMKKGYGAGSSTERSKGLSPYSLQQIPYVGPKYEENFKKNKVETITDLMDYDQNPKQLSVLLERVFLKKNGAFDEKAYNSTLMWLYKRGIKNLPECYDIKSI